jgi:two-component system, LytTR family, response regulator
MHDQKLRTIIVDDDEQAINNLEIILKDFPQVHIIDRSTDPEKALGKILIQKPDLLFMDIQMPDKTGFEIVSEVYRSGLKPEIIFVTAYDKYAITAIRYAAFDYLLKPVIREELTNALDRLTEKSDESVNEDRINLLLEHTSKQKIKFTNTGGFILIKPEDIIYIEADWNYIDIWLGKDKKEVVAMNIGSVEELLPEQDFYRINRSIIINVNYLTRVIRKKLTAVLIKEGQEFLFKIPILKIRGLEMFLS